MLGDDHERQLEEEYKQGQIDQETATQQRLAESKDHIKALQQEIQSLKSSSTATIAHMESKFNNKTDKEAGLVQKVRNLEQEKSDLAEQLIQSRQLCER